MTLRRHDDWIRSYLDAVVSRSEAPERFHFWCACSVIAGAVRRRVFIDMEAFQWYPNLYVILVGPPGIVKKSTTINIGARLLRDVPGVQFGADVNTWEGFIQQLDEAKDIFTDDQGKLSTSTTHTVSCALTLSVSEWGTFFDPRNWSMVQMLTELYDGKTDIPMTKYTKTQGTNFISNPFVNMIAGTTPLWLRDNFKTNFAGWGLSSRCVFMHCLEPERQIPYPDEVWNGMYRGSMKSFLDDLIVISQLQGGCYLKPEARNYGRDWYHQHVLRKRELDADPNHDEWLSYYLARKWDHVHKLAIILSISRRSDLVVDVDTLREATQRCDEVEGEMGRIFGGVSAQPRPQEGEVRMNIWRGMRELIEASPEQKVAAKDAYQLAMPFMNWSQFEGLLKQLQASRLLTTAADAKGIYYRKGDKA